MHPGATEIQCNNKDDDCQGGDACNTCAGSVCGGKCGASAPAGTINGPCLIELVPGVCLIYTTKDCYCDGYCQTAGDCCPGYATCCK